MRIFFGWDGERCGENLYFNVYIYSKIDITLVLREFMQIRIAILFKK